MTKLKAVRQARGYSITQLTCMTGIATSDLSAVENSKRFPFKGWRKKISRVLQTPEREIFSDDGNAKII